MSLKGSMGMRLMGNLGMSIKGKLGMDFSEWHNRLSKIILILLPSVFFYFFVSAQQPKGAVSEEELAKSNNPLASLNQVSFHDYLTFNSRGTTETANTMNLRGVVVKGRQIIRGTLPVTTSPEANADGYKSGLGDFSIFDAIKLTPEGAGTDFAVGPMVVAPTATSQYLGSGKWQAGGAVVVIHHIPGGSVFGSLITYQHSFTGQADRQDVSVLGVQPTLTFNLGGGLYGRSAGAVWQFDLENKRTLIPFGLGIGKVSKMGSVMVNIFLEPQLTVYSTGVSQPAYQVFFGMNLQWH